LGTAACVAGRNPISSIAPGHHRDEERGDYSESSPLWLRPRGAHCGIRFIEVETRDELEHAINEHTAMMLFFKCRRPPGQISVEEFPQLGKKHAFHFQ